MLLRDGSHLSVAGQKIVSDCLLTTLRAAIQDRAANAQTV